ncbi:hypothetical protein [Streptomyces sp. NPDC050121]|uniref:hypothetical protein n=1 Tax=Streptomyces sp. NPDC050121 TaxID=3365601 RepID=UPI003795FE25
MVPDLFQARGLETVGLVDDEKLGVAGGSRREARRRVRPAETEMVGMPQMCQAGSGLRQIAWRSASAVFSAEGAPRLTAYPAIARE